MIADKRYDHFHPRLLFRPDTTALVESDHAALDPTTQYLRGMIDRAALSSPAVNGSSDGPCKVPFLDSRAELLITNPTLPAPGPPFPFNTPIQER